jgi:hypothetical protein
VRPSHGLIIHPSDELVVIDLQLAAATEVHAVNDIEMVSKHW